MLSKPGRKGWWGGVFAILLLLVLQRSPLAAGPTIVMIYGEAMPKPLFVLATGDEPTMGTQFLWGGEPDGTTVDQLSGRAYVKVALFWGRDRWSEYLAYPSRLNHLDAADANQHGRFYPPTPSQPAAMVVTTIQKGEAFGDPTDQSLVSGWRLSEEDLMSAQRLGIPGLTPGPE